MKNLKISSLLDVYGEFLSEKQKTVTEHYYNNDLSLAEIAENEGITRQAVNDLIKRAEAQLSAYEQKCGYLEKISELKKLAAELSLDGDRDNRKIDRIIDIIEKF